eukprot:scaffold15278_cov129-Isochrysis_galbana.AAC.3
MHIAWSWSLKSETVKSCWDMGGLLKHFLAPVTFLFSAKLSATRCSAMEATGETAPLGPALGSGGLILFIANPSPPPPFLKITITPAPTPEPLSAVE